MLSRISSMIDEYQLWPHGYVATATLHASRPALLQLAEAFEFNLEVSERFIRWVQDSLELRERGQQLLVEM